MKKIACLTLDIEADFLDPAGRIRLIEDEALLHRYVSILERRGVKLTAFLVTSLIGKYGDAYRRLCDTLPLEFAIHSHAHDMHAPCTPDDIQQSVHAFRSFMGFLPLGYRAPGGQITRLGLKTLMDLGLRYDSSIYPSVRPGSPWGYSNLHFPPTPFRLRSGDQSILELPFASLTAIRLNFSLSYVKLFGWPAYRLLLKLFPLPHQVTVLSHPYDHYFHLLGDSGAAPEKPLLNRNAGSAFELLEKMLDHLIASGYEFSFMSELCNSLEGSALPVYSLEKIVDARRK